MLDKLDDDVLLAIHTIVYQLQEANSAVDIVGYEADGKPVTEEQLVQDVIEIEKESGSIFANDMFKKADEWLNSHK